MLVEAAEGTRRWGRRTLALAALLNIAVAVWLGLVWQGGGARSLQAISEAETVWRAGGREVGAVIKVDLLCQCHSTPAYSHLLSLGGGVVIDGLDCSPECRSSGGCSNDLWNQDKLGFVKGRENDFDYAIVDVGKDGGSGEEAVAWLVRETGAEELGRYFQRFGEEFVVLARGREAMMPRSDDSKPTQTREEVEDTKENKNGKEEL